MLEKNIYMPYWHQINKKRDFPTMSENKEYDVLIVGGGLAGLTTAYLLLNKGLKIGLVEASKIGQGTTGYSSAKITLQHGLKYDYLITSFGKSKAMQYAKANNKAIDIIKNIVKKNKINCDFTEQPAYLYTTKDNEIDLLEKEFKSYQDINIDSEYIDTTELPFPIKGALKINNQAYFHPLKYIYALSEIIENSGCEVFENTRAIEIKGNSPFTTVTNKGDIISNVVVVASHFPFLKNHGMYYMRMHTERSYILALKTENPSFNGMYINLNEPTYSIRYHKSNNEDILLLGGGNHKTGLMKHEKEAYLELENFAKEKFNNPQIIARWSTQDCMPIDKVPYIGQMNKKTQNLYVATGFGKWGMTGATVAAQIISDNILKYDNLYTDVFNPIRFTPKESASEFLSNSINVVGGLVSKVFSIPLRSIKDIKADEGKIVEYNGDKIGVYRDKQGKFNAIVPICTHLGCQLKFNESEKTWDCICHGSRFDIKGNVIEGPAVEPLKNVIIEQGDI